MKNFKKDLIIHWIIYNVSVLVFLFTALWLSSLKVVPVWVLGGSLVVALVVLFTFYCWLFLLKLRGRK